MSELLNITIYLSDNENELKRKVMSENIDSNHIQINDPGNLAENLVFEYLDGFIKYDCFEKYYPEFHIL